MTPLYHEEDEHFGANSSSPPPPQRRSAAAAAATYESPRQSYDDGARDKAASRVDAFMDKYVDRHEDVEYVKSLSSFEFDTLVDTALELAASTEQGEAAPLKFRVIQSNLSDDVKLRILRQLKSGSTTPGSDAKYNAWVESLLQIPFESATEEAEEDDVVCGDSGTLLSAFEGLEREVFGHATTKQDILKRILLKQFKSPTAPILICGPPGVGKTRLARCALAKALKRPFCEIPMGGATNADFLRGSLYVYEGSGPGRIVTALKNCGRMDPLIFMDEIDKVADTPQGHEIIASLLQIIDPNVNNSFEDKFFPGVKIDLSKCQFVFAANDLRRVDPVLRDRMDVVMIDAYTEEEKRCIVKRHIVPEMCAEVAIKVNENDGDDNVGLLAIAIDDTAFDEWMQRSNDETGGVRRLREVVRHTIQGIAVAQRMLDIDADGGALPAAMGIPEEALVAVKQGTVKVDAALVAAILDQRAGASNIAASRNEMMYI